MKLDIKNIAIVILGFLLVLSFMIGKKEGEVNKEFEIKALHESNQDLLDKNDSLIKSIGFLNIKIDSTQQLLVANNKKVIELQIQIQKLKDEKNKIPYTVKHMSANVVANTFSKYLNKRD